MPESAMWAAALDAGAGYEDRENSTMDDSYDKAFLRIGRFIGPEWGRIKKQIVAVFKQALTPQLLVQLQQDPHLDPALSLETQASKLRYRQSLNQKLSDGELTDSFLLHYLEHLKNTASQKLENYRQRSAESHDIQNLRIVLAEKLDEEHQTFKQTHGSVFFRSIALCLTQHEGDMASIRFALTELLVEWLGLSGKLAANQGKLINEYIDTVYNGYRLNRVSHGRREQRVAAAIGRYIEQSKLRDQNVLNALALRHIADVDIWLAQFVLPGDDPAQVTMQQLLFGAPVYEDYFVRFAHRISKLLPTDRQAPAVLPGAKQMTVTKNFVADINGVISLAELLGVAGKPGGYQAELLLVGKRPGKEAGKSAEKSNSAVHKRAVIAGTEYEQYLNKWMAATLRSNINNKIKAFKNEAAADWTRLQQAAVNALGAAPQGDLLQACIDSPGLAELRGKTTKAEFRQIWQNVATEQVAAIAPQCQDRLLLVYHGLHHKARSSASPLLCQIGEYADHCIQGKMSQVLLAKARADILQHCALHLLVQGMAERFGVQADNVLERFLLALAENELAENALAEHELSGSSLNALTDDDYYPLMCWENAAEKAVEYYADQAVSYLTGLADEPVIAKLLKGIGKITYQDKFLKQQVININRVDVIFNFITELLCHSRFDLLAQVLTAKGYLAADLDGLFNRLEAVAPSADGKASQTPAQLFLAFLADIGLDQPSAVTLQHSLMACYALSRIFNLAAASLLQQTPYRLFLTVGDSLFEQIKSAVLAYPPLMQNPLFKKLKFMLADEEYVPPSAKDLGDQIEAVFSFIEDNCYLSQRVKMLLPVEVNAPLTDMFELLPQGEDYATADPALAEPFDQ